MAIYIIINKNNLETVFQEIDFYKVSVSTQYEWSKIYVNHWKCACVQSKGFYLIINMLEYKCINKLHWQALEASMGFWFLTAYLEWYKSSLLQYLHLQFSFNDYINNISLKLYSIIKTEMFSSVAEEKRWQIKWKKKQTFFFN